MSGTWWTLYKNDLSLYIKTMKEANFSFFIVLIVLSGAVHAQILEPNDIDIYINEYSTINEMFIDDRFVEYTKRVTEILVTIFDVDFDEDTLSNDEFDVLHADWGDFLEIEVPRKIEAAFRKMGWVANGHKKLWTITFGAVLLMNYEDDRTEANIALLNLVHKDDITLLKENMDVLMDAVD